MSSDDFDLNNNSRNDQFRRAFFKDFKGSHMFKFINAILFKWYFIVMVPAVTALYYFLKILHDKGLLQKIEHFIIKCMDSIVNISKTCTYYLPDVYGFVECAGRF